MKEVGFEQIAIVLECWDEARFASKTFDKDFGMVALQRLFELQPRARSAFGYDKGDAVGDAHAALHANAFAGLFDTVFQLLGPDIDFLQDILKQVGRRHKAMKVSPSFFPFMGQALIFAVEKYLGRKLTQEQRECWEDVYECISHEIVKNILQ